MITVGHLYPHLITRHIICANAYITCGKPRGKAPTHYMCKQIESAVMVYTNNINRKYDNLYIL